MAKSMDGECHDYCPRTHEVGYVARIWNDEVMVVDRNEIESIPGESKVQEIYAVARAHLDRMKDYFEKYPAQVLYTSSSKEYAALKQRKLAEILNVQAEQSSNIAHLLGLSSLLTNKGASMTDINDDEKHSSMLSM